MYLENDVKLTNTLVISDGTVYLCLNGKTLTIDKAGYPAVSIGANQKFVLCDCIGTGKITGAKGSAENDPARFGAVNCKSGSNFAMYGGTTVIGNTSSVNGSANNLYLNNGRMFQFRKGLTGTEKVGVSVPGTPTLAKPINIEWVFDAVWHDTEGDRSNLIIPDNDSYTVIYNSNVKMHQLIPKPLLTLTADKISVSNLNKPAVLFVASYDGNGLLDIKKIEIGADTEKTVTETGLNTANAVKISAFLWDNSDGKWDVNMYPLCNGAQTNLKDL